MLLQIFISYREIAADEELTLDYINGPIKLDELLIGYRLYQCKCGCNNCTGARLRRLAVGKGTSEDKKFIDDKVVAHSCYDGFELYVNSSSFIVWWYVIWWISAVHDKILCYDVWHNEWSVFICTMILFLAMLYNGGYILMLIFLIILMFHIA